MSSLADQVAAEEATERLRREIQDQIFEEVSAIRERQRQVDKEAAIQRGRVSKLMGKNHDKPMSAEAEKAHDHLMRLIHRGTTYGEQVQRLTAPAEVERRVQEKLDNTDSLRRLKMATAEKTKKPTARDQGFPDVYLGENGNFRVGMDARAKSDLVCLILGVESSDSILPSNVTVTSAEKLIKARGWESFVDKKRESIASAAAKAEKRQAEKEAAAEAKAQEKADAAAAKAAAKASSDGGSTDVKPDPKPTSTKKAGRRPVRKSAA